MKHAKKKSMKPTVSFNANTKNYSIIGKICHLRFNSRHIKMRKSGNILCKRIKIWKKNMNALANEAKKK